MKNLIRSQKAFTLIELLVVVLILGILIAVALPSYMSSVKDSRTKAAATNARMIATAAQQSAVRNGAYPADFTDATFLADLGGSIPTNPCTGTATAADWGYTTTATSATITPVTTNCNTIAPITVKINP